MIIKMVKEFKLTVVHSAHPNLMQLYAGTWGFTAGPKTVEHQDWAMGLRAIAGPGVLGRRGLLDLWAVMGRATLCKILAEISPLAGILLHAQGLAEMAEISSRSRHMRGVSLR